MSLEENKAIAREWVRRFNLADAKLLTELYSDEEFNWRISGLSPVSAAYDKKGAIELLTKSFAVKMKRPMHLVLKSITAEEDRVSFEMAGEAQFENGATIKNYYHMLITVRNGKIVRGRAYFDTYTAANSPLQRGLEAQS